ncbi:MAG: 5-methyltetrahydrofolate--homocysteine methyltransferase [Bacteroidaceae bacterium]|nr:5-methyltetrahydrofolate--homocysteine methyltransferase [Bacteroidaceae bacterium]
MSILNYRLSEVVPYINWLYFFNTWGFPARYGNVAQVHNCTSCRAQWLASFPDEEQAKAREAMRLYDDALKLLRDLEGLAGSHAIVALYEANADGDDIVLHGREAQGTRLPMLRQQHGDPCLSWADYLLPLESGRRDRVGLFVTSVDESMVSGGDDYHRLLAQTLADRLAEATAERMHEEVRRRLWGYAKDERLTVEEMFQEKYVGRRPAVGYPSLPDQSLNFLIDQLLDMSRIGVSLTESGAMRPHASTSGLIFAHPRASHFAIGPIGTDQLRDYALRRGLPESEVRRFLAANL